MQNTLAGVKKKSVQYLLRVIALIFLADVLGLELLPLLGFFSKMHSSFFDLHRLFKWRDRSFGGVNAERRNVLWLAARTMGVVFACGACHRCNCHHRRQRGC